MVIKEGLELDLGFVTLIGDLTIAHEATGLVIFAHGSGSSRFSVRNRAVAQQLNDQGLATLLVDLLTAKEEEIDNVTRELRFDIPMLAGRLVGITQWIKGYEATKDLDLGYFGSSTGAAAALIAAAELPEVIKAVVSRGGRPDLGQVALPDVQAATLLIVGGHDVQVIEMNKFAYELLSVEHKELKIIPGATHLFEEPGALEQVAELAAQWFVQYLA